MGPSWSIRTRAPAAAAVVAVARTARAPARVVRRPAVVRVKAAARAARRARPRRALVWVAGAEASVIRLVLRVARRPWPEPAVWAAAPTSRLQPTTPRARAA